MLETNITISGSSSNSKIILNSHSASISEHSSNSKFYNAIAGVVACPWYNGNGPCTLQIRLALPHQFDKASAGGMSDASFQAL